MCIIMKEGWNNGGYLSYCAKKITYNVEQLKDKNANATIFNNVLL